MSMSDQKVQNDRQSHVVESESPEAASRCRRREYEAIEHRTKVYDVCVVGGLGHVGLPLGLSFAAAGKRTVLYDINSETINRVSEGRMPFIEEGAEEVLRSVLGKTLFISADRSMISRSKFVIVVIGTPVDEHLNPEYAIFRKFFEDVVDFLDDSQHVILRSTVFPGTTEKVAKYLGDRGKKTRLSFCPERIAEGKAMEELRSLPQIVSSYTPEGEQEARDLFSVLTQDVVVLSPVEAETAKLFSNVWRYILFSIANQFYEIATQQGLDFYRIYDAITHKYPRMNGLPRPGFAAGPCLFKDTMQLAAFTDNSFFLGHAAMLINEGLPNFIVRQLKIKHSLKEKTVGILGMAFKANSDDKRESLSYKLKKILEVEARQVLCSDVHIHDPGFVSEADLVRRSDIVIVGAPHREYRTLQIDNRVLIDVWNFYGKGGQF